MEPGGSSGGSGGDGSAGVAGYRWSGIVEQQLVLACVAVGLSTLLAVVGGRLNAPTRATWQVVDGTRLLSADGVAVNA